MATPTEVLSDLWSITNAVEKIKNSTNGDEVAEAKQDLA